jgi:hypothetical protein
MLPMLQEYIKRDKIILPEILFHGQVYHAELSREGEMAMPPYASAQDVPLLSTKLDIPPPRSRLVSRSRLTQ